MRRRTPREALYEAHRVADHLRTRMPVKAGEVLTSIDEIDEAWKEQERSQFPFNLLVSDLEAITGAVSSEYATPDEEVDRRSVVFERVVEFSHRLRLSMEFLSVSKVLEALEGRFARIDTVLPSENYSLRALVGQLGKDIPAPPRRRLEAALHYFDRQDYRASLRECGEAGESLFAIFRKQLARCGFEERSWAVGPELLRIRAWLASADSKDLHGCRFSPSSRVEWLLLHLFETLHYVRNAAMHAPEAEDRLPGWQSERRSAWTEGPDLARLGLCASLQIAVELQALLEHLGGFE